jgi:hypothetical protein
MLISAQPGGPLMISQTPDQADLRALVVAGDDALFRRVSRALEIAGGRVWTYRCLDAAAGLDFVATPPGTERPWIDVMLVEAASAARVLDCLRIELGCSLPLVVLGGPGDIDDELALVLSDAIDHVDERALGQFFVDLWFHTDMGADRARAIA